MNEEPIYKKVNGKYVKVGYEFRGFYANGIWYVNKTNGGYIQTCILSESELDNIHVPTIASLHHKLQKKNLWKDFHDWLNNYRETKNYGPSSNEIFIKVITLLGKGSKSPDEELEKYVLDFLED